MLEVRNLSVSTLAGRKLLDGVTFVANDNDKIAIIGEEGNGKTTLLKAIYDKSLLAKDFVVSGSIVKPSDIGYLEQILNPEWYNFTAVDYLLMKDINSEPDYAIYNDFGEISQLVSKFGLKEDFLDGVQPIGTLSGGEKVKLQLIKILYHNPSLILMDEPTNDLDIETLEMLEKFICESKTPIIYVSHDETLLERTANHILHLEQIKRKTEPRSTFSALSYNEYVSTRAAALIKQDQIATSEQAERKEQLRITNEIKGKIQQANPGRTNSMRAVIAREARWERTEVTQHTDTEDSIRLRFAYDAELPAKKQVLKLNLPVLENEDKVLAENVVLNVVGPQRVVIVGKNGCGKSTLLKQIYKKYMEEPVSGLKVSYMPQNYEDFLDMEGTPLDYLCHDASKQEQELVRTVLGRLKFTSQEMQTQIKYLSGGQRAKVYLTHLMMRESNVLILDEPTRNLSPLSNPAVREFFNSYQGAIISVSHDRKFISEVCDQVYELDKNGLKERTDLLNCEDDDWVPN